jgi:hypothetical protein
MSDSNRSEFVALVAVVCTVVIFLVGLAAGLGNPAGEQKTSQSYQQVRGYAEGNVSQVHASADDFDFWEDPFPQYAMAIFAAFATGASFWAIIEVRKTFKETKRTADAAVSALGSERAWVGYDGIQAGPFTDGKVSGKPVSNGLIFHVHWQNSGRSPAVKVRIHTDYRLWNGGDVPVFEVGADMGAYPGNTNLNPSKSVMATRILGDGEAALFRAGVRMIVYSRVSYFDLFSDVQRHAEICGELTIGGTYQQDGGPVLINVLLNPLGSQNSIS